MSESKGMDNRIRKNALLPILTVFLMLAFSFAIVAQAALITSEENAWSALQDAINSAGSGETVTLSADVSAGESDSMLTVPDGAVITLDLNGHTLDRRMSELDGVGGAVIEVQPGAVLTVKDGSKDADGQITGGYAPHAGGIRNSGTLILEGGVITGNNTVDSGGGISNFGVCIIKGGSVTSNTAGKEGGGVYNDVKGYLTVDMNAVFGNQAAKGDDVYNVGSMKVIGGETVDFAAMESALNAVGVLPTVVLLIALFIAVRLDNYLDRRQKRAMYIVTVLVLTLVLQNYLDTWLYRTGNPTMLRTIVSIYGYAVRPAILAVFLRIINPGGNHKIAWAAVGVNAAIYLTALFSPLTFSYPNGHFVSGPLSKTNLVVSAILFVYCIYLTFKVFRPKQKKETWIPAFVLVLISLSLVMDYTAVYNETPVSYLTIAIAISCMLYYIWLHLQFVREHERALQAEHRIQIMMTQIQPHFLFNTLTAIRALCVRDQDAAVRAIGLFSSYLRQNLSSLNQTEAIPLSKELEHTRIYTEIEMIRFPNIRIEYDIRDDDCRVPALTVQPLAENAVRHGARNREDGIVRVSSYREGNEHLIVIEDNGTGFEELPAANTDGTHIGIANVRERLERMCHGTMTIDSRPGEGTRVVLRIPVSEEMNK